MDTHSNLPLFFFGTMKDPDIFEIVVGQPLDSFARTEAVYPGHAVLREKQEAYPVLAERDGANAPGLLVSGLNETEVDRIQFFESIEYDLLPICVDCNGAEQGARCFIATELLACEERAWQIENWHTTDKDRALIEAVLLMDLYGRIPREEVEDHWPAIVEEANRQINARKSASFA
ncbi:gamma-glutamylcyclotransferase [Coralliovum pocilloporae]|uniref:gamma-glutamylcyclotransferase n=1 Tax=Coralliovum pocilloporae TaxID=3066369 RepID=UPI003307B43C